MSDLELLIYLLKRHPELLDGALAIAQQLGLWPKDRPLDQGDEEEPFIWDEDAHAFDPSCDD